MNVISGAERKEEKTTTKKREKMLRLPIFYPIIRRRPRPWRDGVSCDVTNVGGENPQTRNAFVD